MNGRDDISLPEHVRDQPLQVQLAVLYERVKNLNEEVKSLRRTLWVFISAIVSGAVLFLVSVASGWVGPKASAAAALHFAMRWFH